MHPDAEHIQEASPSAFSSQGPFFGHLTPRQAAPADTSIILETDAAAIASRVTRPKPDSTDIVINEQTLLNACEWAQ